MADIKLKDTVKGTIRTLDRAANLGDRMKDAYVRTKDKAEHSTSPKEGSANEYAADRITDTTEAVSREAVHQFDKQGRKAVSETKDNIGKAKEHWQKRKEEKEKAKQEAEQHRQDTPEPPEPTPQTEGQPQGVQPEHPPTQTQNSGSSPSHPQADEFLQQRKAEQPREYAIKRAEKASRRNTADRIADTPQSGNRVQTHHTEHPKTLAQKQVERVERTARRNTHRGAKTIKTADRSAKTVKQTAKSTGKATVKGAQKTVKTAEQTGRAAIKTSQAAAKTAQKTAQAAAKASQRAVQAARAAAKATVAGIKAAVKATIAAVKAIITGVKALVAAIAAGGWVAVLIIVIICLVALIVCSCFGIFFSSEDTGSAQTMQDVVREINADYESQLATIKANITYDELEMSGSRAVWPDVLSVYAVKTTSDPDNPQEVATMDDSKKAILKDIFWQMNTISSRTEIREETEIVETDDGHGNIIETEVTVTKTVLYITVSHKAADEMATHFGFSQDQKDQLSALLEPGNRQMWAAVLYGIGSSDDQIVLVARSQIGNVGGDPYWSWYGFGSRVEWCACFVSWCANECGYIENGIIPKFAGCVNGVNWFKQRSQWADNNIEPTPGMIIFFDWDSPDGESGPQDGLSDHVGIVEKIENGRVYTIEGNTSDSCRQRSYPVGYYEILGYGIPAY